MTRYRINCPHFGAGFSFAIINVNMNQIVKIVKIRSDAHVPSCAHDGDAGLDLCAIERTELSPMMPTSVQTGIKMEIPYGYVGLIWDKSGLAIKNGLKILGGVIDAGYRGEIIVGIVNTGSNPYTLEKGDKVAQILIQKVENVDIEEVSELSDTTRGKGGFGSTGK